MVCVCVSCSYLSVPEFAVVMDERQVRVHVAWLAPALL